MVALERIVWVGGGEYVNSVEWQL